MFLLVSEILDHWNTIAAAVLIGPTTGSAWVTGSASSDFIALVGVPGVALEARGGVEIVNTADREGRVIDFEAEPLEIPLGIGIDIGLFDTDLPLGDGTVPSILLGPC